MIRQRGTIMNNCTKAAPRSPSKKPTAAPSWALFAGGGVLLILVAGIAGFTHSGVQVNQDTASISEVPLAGIQPAAFQPAEKTPATTKDAAKGSDKKPKAPAVVRPVPGAGTKQSIAGLASIIDKESQVRLDEEKVPVSPLADDAEFLRRVYLDLSGVIPPPDRVVAFLDSTDKNKRAKVIDELLADPRHGKFLAEIWTDMLIPRDSGNRRLKSEPLQEWLTAKFDKNTPWNKLVSDLVTATGAQDENGAVTFFVANPTPDKVTDHVTRLFLGVQLQCAQCHNHPFTAWKQTEYWGMAAFFMKVKTDNPNKTAKNGTSASVTEKAGGKKAKLPEGAKIVPAKFLGAEQPKLSPSQPYRPVLAKWMTSAKNPFFARAMANRMWGHFFGRGLVNPVDDMHDNNPAAHPELLSALAEQFTANNFDVNYLIRAICNSQTYQRSSRTVKGNQDDAELFSHMAIKALSPQQLYDSLTLIVGTPGKQGKQGAGKNKVAAKKGPVGPREQFINFFRTDEGADPTEYQSGIPQVLRLMNSAQLNNTSAALDRVLKGGSTPTQVVERLYLTVLSRRPTSEESTRLTSYVAKHSGTARQAYGDILWALLNCSEFALNH
jgi:hypothetical protein